MQTWAKRGLQTALVTGGLLMLGTGIASANENVNPDRPASPIDGGLAVPVRVANNTVGTPIGQLQPPSVDRTVGTDDVTGALPAQVSGPAAGVANTAAVPLSGIAPDGVVDANRGRVDVVVPVDVSGNAIAAGGNAYVANDSTQTVDRPDPVFAGWAPGTATDNVVAVNHAAPVQVTGNAVSLLGAAGSVNNATQSATTGGDITTDGTGRTLAGNIVAEQGATPVQVNGNAVAGGGRADTLSTTDSTANSDGSLGTNGDNGTGSGNVGAVPLAVPVEVTDQAVSGIGNANSAGRNTADAKSGDSTLPGAHGPSYLATDGDPATASGNAVVPAMANPVSVACNAVGAIGNTGAQCASANTTTAGGDVTTGGVGSTGSGNLATAPVTEPTSVFGNSAAGIGNATAGAYNTDSSTALGNAYTLGDGSALSSNAVTAPVAGANDVFAGGVSAIGNAAGTAGNDVTSGAGGYTGTTGTGATGSGNIGQVPVAAPVETYGLTGSLAGTAAGTVPAENKTVRAGGSPNSKDDRGTASSNVVSAPTAVPTQVFGDAAGVVANTGSAADNTSTVNAGGHPTATGTAGTASGNIAQLATATPAQVFGDGASVVGNGVATGANDTTIGSGGDAVADGRDGTASGDIVTVPDSGPIQVFGVAGASPGNEEADSLNNTHTTAGGDTTTSGAHGALAGDVVTAPLTQVEQVLGAGLAAGGNARAVGVNDTATRSGGDVITSGEWGALSGDLVGVPATDVTHAIADGGSALGNQRAFADNTTSAVSGGDSRTAGDGFLNGTELVQPLGADATIFRVPVEVLGRAIEHGGNSTSIVDDESAPQVDVPFGTQSAEQQFGPSDAVDGLLRADQVPAIGDLFAVPNLRRGLPGAPLSALDMSQTQVFPAISDLGVAPGLPGLPRVPAVQSLGRVPLDSSPTQVFPAVSGLGHGAPLDLSQTRMIPAVPALGAMPGLPRVPAGLAGVPGLSAVEMTQRLPVIANGPMVPSSRPGSQSRPAVQAQPVSSGIQYLPMTGELPVAGQLSSLPTPGLPTGGLTAPPLPTSGLHAPALPAPGGLHAPTLPTAGATPVSASVPTVTRPNVPNVPAMPSLSTMPDLPPVPTLPAMPPLPGRPSTQDLPAAPVLPALSGTPLPTLPAPSVTGPSVPALPALPAPHVPGPQGLPVPGLPTPSLPAAPSLFAPNIPAVPTLPAPALPASGLPLPSAPTVGAPHVQDVPAGSAQQLMAQLRALISDLENSASGSPSQLRPMDDIQPPTI